MKRTFSCAVVAALVFVGAATAATPAKKIAALQKDVKALQTTVKKQQKTINVLARVLELNFVSDACIVGVTADAFQGTWTTYDQHAGASVFGPQQSISDNAACSVLRQPTVQREGVRVPPTASVFSTLVTWLKPPSASKLLQFFGNG